MTHNLYFTFNDEYDGADISVIDYEYKIEEKLQDIIEYVFENKYNTKYNELSWYLEDGAKELVKSIETKWLHNKLDMYDYYGSGNYDFYEWLKDKYYKDALYKCAVDYELIKPWYATQEQYL